MTPGSATSASSFEEGASYDGFSDGGTPGADAELAKASNQQRFFVKTEDGDATTHYTVKKHPTKRLSSPSRESLARRLMGTSTDLHGMVESEGSLHPEEAQSSDLPPSEMLTNLVVKRVPALTVQTTTTPPQSTKTTRRIVASPRKTLRRRIVRTTGADGKVHEVVQYVDASGNVVNTSEGDFFGGETTAETPTSQLTTTRTTSQGLTIRRVAARNAGVDGQIHEEVRYLDVDGTVVDDGEALFASANEGTTRTTVTTASRETSTRQIATPAKLKKRTLRRTGANGQVCELVQYLDADGNVVKTEGDVTAYENAAKSTSTTRSVTTPSKTVRRVIVRRIGADGKVHEEVQYADANGNVVQSDGSELVRTRSFTKRVVTPGKTLRRVVIRRTGADGLIHEEVRFLDADGNVVSTEGDAASTETVTKDSSGTPGSQRTTRRVVRRMVVGQDGTRVAVDQFIDADGNAIEDEERSLASAGSFTGSVSSVTSETPTGSRRITRRVVTPGRTVRRTVVQSTGSISGAESEDEVRSIDGDFGSERAPTSSRRRTTRRVVTRTAASDSNQDDDTDSLDLDAEFVQSEDSSDESLGGSSRGGFVAYQGVVPRRTTVSASNESKEVTKAIEPETEDAEAVESSTSLGRKTTATRRNMTVVTEPEEGSTSPDTTETSGFQPAVKWDYFTKNEGDSALPREEAAPSDDADEVKTPISVNEDATAPEAVTETVESNETLQGGASPNVGGPSADKDAAIDQPEETAYSVASIDEPSVTTTSNEAPQADILELSPTESDDEVFTTPSNVLEESTEFIDNEADHVPMESPLVPEVIQEGHAAVIPQVSHSIPDVVEEEAAIPVSDADSEDNKPIVAAAAAGASAAVATATLTNSDSPDVVAAAKMSEVHDVSDSSTSSVTTKEFAHEGSVQRPRQSSSGGFWGFFSRSEEEPEQQAAGSVVTNVSEVSEAATNAPEPQHVATSMGVETRTSRKEEQQQPVDEVATVDVVEGEADVVEPVDVNEAVPTFGTAEHSTGAQLAHSDEEISGSPKHSSVLPITAGATAAIVAGAAALASKGPESQTEQQKPSVQESVQGASVTSTEPVKSDEVEEESRGGFWAFFGGKSEPKEARDEILTEIESNKKPEADAVEVKFSPAIEEIVQTTEGAAAVFAVDAPSSPAIITHTTRETDEVQQKIPGSHDGEMESPEGVTYIITDPEEDKAPIQSTKEGQTAITDVPKPDADSDKPQERDSHHVVPAAIAGAAAGVVTSSVASESSAVQPQTVDDTNDEIFTEMSFTPTPAPVVDTTTTTVVTEEAENSTSTPPRKAGRSIWSFWGGREKEKAKSPLSEDGEPMDREQTVSTAAAAPGAASAVATQQEVGPSADQTRSYWHKQDEEHSTQVSYAAAVGAKYGPESKFEAMPASDKIRSPVAKNQGAIDSEEAVAAPAGAGEVTQTTVVVEEEEEFATCRSPSPDGNSRNDVAGAAVIAVTDADLDAVAHSQQPVERESTDRSTDNSEKPARGGFFGLWGKKDKPEEETESKTAVVAATAAAAAATTAVTFASTHNGKVPAEEAERDDAKYFAAAAVAAPQIQSIRRSIPSDGTPKNAASVATVTGKQIRDSDRRTTLLIDGAEPDMELGSGDQYIEVKSPRHGGQEHYDEAAWTVHPRSIEWSKLRLHRRSWKNISEDIVSTANEFVLNEVSGSVQAGEFLVITGPSKGESLALLSCLAGYEDAMEGNVTVNGRAWNEKMDRYIAYIQREDLFYETLTVHEHLVAQARLRMRRTHTDERCLERVERVIEDMGLSDCRDKLIGGGISLRGISRGDRKLLAIATALLTNPSILLAEEPTDGLDTFSAQKIVEKLRWLAFEKGMTVAVTLHHPSSHFYGLYDVLYLVADASCVYDGKAADCVAYFATIGYQCPEYMSPMDYFMLQMVVGDRAVDDEGVARVEMLKREWSQRNAAAYAENEARAAAASADDVVDDYDQKNRYYHMGCCNQLWLLWARHTRRLSRYGFVFWWHLLAALLIGVVFGLVYLQLDLNDQKGIQNFSGAFFYIVVVQMLFIAYRTFVFMPRETAIALQERQEYRGGWYHLLCWYFTKLVAELPALIVLSIVLFVPAFLIIGIGHGFKVYVYMQIVIVLAGWAAVGLAFLTLGVLRKVTLALLVYSVLLVLFVVFGGLLINVTDIPDWLVWLHYISPMKYAFEAMMKIFWKRVGSIDCDWTDERCVALTGDGVLRYYSMRNRSALGDSLILLGICLALIFVAFWFLVYMARKRVSGLQWRYDWTFKGVLGSRRQRSSNAALSQKTAAARSTSAAVDHSANEADNHYIRVETPRVDGHNVCDAPSVVLGWSGLWLKDATDKKSSVSDGEQQKRYLLVNANGSAKCGELSLITGPSSKANIALLESLAGQMKRLRGRITINGAPVAAQKVVDSSAYVQREDLFYETLTMEEHLQFQSELAGAEGDRVEMVLDELELTAKRHMLIRYLSAADLKLLAIATGLLSNPSILLVEEPTYGMDFYSSQLVVLKLRQLARSGRTVVVSMEHPSSHLYALFDVLYLLAGGAAVYQGKVSMAVPHFASLGFQCPQYMSPIDYFIRLMITGSKNSEHDDGQVNLFKEAWSTHYAEPISANGDDSWEVQGSGVSHRRRIGCCGQLSMLFSRHVLRLRRYYVVFGWHSFWMIVLSVIFGLVFLQLDVENQQDIQNWAGAFFYIIVLQMLVIAYRTFVFLPREMAIAEREHRGGRYYLACWYLTKVLAELPPLLVLSILLFVPAYLLIGIGHGFKLYFYMQLVMWLAAWSAAGLVTILMGLFRHLRVALLVYALLLVLFVVFGGLLVNVDDIPDYLIWLHYISPVKYGYEALMKLFWGRIGLLLCGGSDGSGSSSSSFGSVGDDAFVGDDASFSMSGSGLFDGDDCIAHSGYEVLTHYSMDSSRSARSDTLILLELTVLYFIIGYAFLSLRWRRYKTRQTQHQAKSPIDN